MVKLNDVTNRLNPKSDCKYPKSGSNSLVTTLSFTFKKTSIVSLRAVWLRL